MEALLILAALAFFFLPLGLSIAAFSRAGAAKTLVAGLLARITKLEAEIGRLRTPPATSTESAPAPKPAEGAPSPVLASVPEPVAPAPRPEIPPVNAPERSAPVSLPPPLPTVPPLASKPVPESQAAAARPVAPARPAISWEQFVGAKLFAWIGGLALFLGLAFFVKYSFENNLISPEVRIAIGFLIGLGLLVSGVLLKPKALAVTAQTLCATGVLTLYACTFASRGFYHFAFFSLIPTLLLMSLITAVAFFLAVRLNAQVVAVLGILGGFLTPALLSTGQDNPWGLFGYIALINVGLLAVSLHRRWDYLVPLGAIATGFTQIVWTGDFFASENYHLGQKVLIPMTILAGFVWLFTAAAAWAKRRDQLSPLLSGSALGLAMLGLAFAVYFLTFTTLASRPVLVFSYVFLLDLAVLALVLIDPKRSAFLPLSGLIVFGLLAGWTSNSITPALLNAGLALYLVFTVFHSAAPLILQRLKKIASPGWWSQLFPALALILALGPLLETSGLSFLIWPFVLLVDLIAIGLAILSATLLPILVVLVLTLVVAACALGNVPPTLTGLPTSLTMLGFFAVFFMLASVWAARRLTLNPFAGKIGKLDLSAPEALAALLPACSVVLPFLLLIMVSARLPITNPSSLFALALLLVVLLLGLAKLLRAEALPLVGLLSTLALEHAWYFEHFDPAHAALPLSWFIGFYLLFGCFPFLFSSEFRDKVLPWAAAALAGPLHFILIHRLVLAAYPNAMMGLIPAAFVVPSLLGLFFLLKRAPAASAQLAWFGGVALFFITMIFPVQFDREWITIGWALEGAALCWLFLRIPHRGLPLVGVSLLAIAFVRLAANPAVLSYHLRSGSPIFNWYLYAYGLVTVCLFVAARLLAPPRNIVLGSNVPPLLYGLGTVLAFLLVNIEIADFFTVAGSPVVTLQFSGNLARDMSYSIAWALFALLLVVIGIRQRVAAIRFAGIGLLSVTLLKLFFHDLSELGQLYRIGALIAVAIIAMCASFLYQRFLSAVLSSDENPPPQP